MKNALKWTAIIAGALAVIAFIAFLYFIPPFTLAPPESFIRPERSAPPALDTIADPAERLLAGRGKYLVQILGCAGCHTATGDKGPKWDAYLAGGMKFSFSRYGTVVSRNLTPDRATGLARRSDEEVQRVLRTGLSPEGRVFHPFMMPWGDFSNLSEEDRHAIVVFLRHLKPVKHTIPDFTPKSNDTLPTIWGGLDYAEGGK